MKPQKHLGQHFLSDPRILRRIADAALIEPGNTVLEIGPGPGTLTRILAETGVQVIAIEKDRRMISQLRTSLGQVRIVEGDALKLDWHELVGPCPSGFVVVGNIPYNITSPLIHQAMRHPRPRRIVFLVQKEVGLRITARPRTKAYGALSVGVQSQARAERLFDVPAGAFRPPPKVDSTVIRITPYDISPIPEYRETSFRRLVTALFAARRKQLLRGLRQVTGWPADKVETLLRSLGCDPASRPEELSPQSFVALFNRLVDLE